jgi:CCR4-NOT transcription complex subunit 9
MPLAPPTSSTPQPQQSQQQQQGGGSTPGGGGNQGQHKLFLLASNSGSDEGEIMGLIGDLLDSGTREGALQELSKKRELYDDLALVLWHSFGSSSPWLARLTGVEEPQSDLLALLASIG